MTFAVIPACGQSTRMGQSKLSMPLGNATVIERVIQTLQAGGVDTVLVVTGPHHPGVAPLAPRAGALVIELPQPTEDMRATTLAGLAYLQGRYQVASDDPWLLAPGDFPAFSASTVSALLQAAQRQSPPSIVVPSNRGKRGHPLLLRWKHIEGIQSLPPHLGINAFVHEQAEVHEVEVNDAGIHLNLNTPTDYTILLAELVRSKSGAT